MLRVNMLFVGLLLMFCVGTVQVVDAHSTGEHSGWDLAWKYYNRAGWQYALAYGKWETEARILDRLKGKRDLAQYQWDTLIASLDVSSRSLISPNPSDWINHGWTYVRDAWAGREKASVLSELQSKVSTQKTKVDTAATERDNKQTALETATANLQAMQHQCSGCSVYFDEDPSTTEGHRALLCAEQHTYYQCSDSNTFDKHTTTVTCSQGHSHLECVSDRHVHSATCPGCNATYDPQNSTQEARHRARSCYGKWSAGVFLGGCGSLFRRCDSSLSCMALPTGHSEY